MALEPKYEEERDIRMSVTEEHLLASLERHLKGSEYRVEVKDAGRLRPGVVGPQPRGSIVVKKGGLLGKKVAEFYATGHWELDPEFEKMFEPVRSELQARVCAAVARANVGKVGYALGPRTSLEGTGDGGFRDLVVRYLESVAEECEARASGSPAEVVAVLETLRKEMESKLQSHPRHAERGWQRDLIPM